MTCCKADQFQWCASLPALCKDNSGKEYCVFHAPEDHKPISIEQFNRDIAAIVIDAYIHNKDCDLSGAIFPGHVSLNELVSNAKEPYRTQTKLLFRSCRFVGSVKCSGNIWSPVYFSSSTFCGHADFSETTFQSYVEFTSAKFEKDAFFKKPVFGGDAVFIGVEFLKGCSSESAGMRPEMNINFNNALFFGETSFFDFSPSGSSHVSFIGATFANHAVFKGSDYPGNTTTFCQAILPFADFSGSKLGGVNFEGVMLEGANLKGASLKGSNLAGSFLVGANLDYTDLSSADLTFADLTSASLEGANFRKTDLTRADLRGAKGCACWLNAMVEGVVLDRAILRTIPKEVYKSKIHSIVVEGLPAINLYICGTPSHKNNP